MIIILKKCTLIINYYKNLVMDTLLNYTQNKKISIISLNIVTILVYLWLTIFLKVKKIMF